MSIFDQFDNLPKDLQKRKVSLEFSEYEYVQEEKELDEKPKKSFWFFYSVVLGIFLVLVAQLLNLQISQGSFNRYLAEGNRIRERKIPAPRGIIYDKKSFPLVGNDASFSLEVYPLDI